MSIFLRVSFSRERGDCHFLDFHGLRLVFGTCRLSAWNRAVLEIGSTSPVLKRGLAWLGLIHVRGFQSQAEACRLGALWSWRRRPKSVDPLLANNLDHRAAGCRVDGRGKEF